MIQHSRKSDSHISSGWLGIILPSQIRASANFPALSVRPWPISPMRDPWPCQNKRNLYSMNMCWSGWSTNVYWYDVSSKYDHVKLSLIIIHYLYNLHLSIHPSVCRISNLRKHSLIRYLPLQLVYSACQHPPSNLQKNYTTFPTKNSAKNICSHSLITAPWLRSHWNWRLSQWHEAQRLRGNLSWTKS